MIAIVKVTLKEALRKKTFFVMAAVGLLFLLLWSLLLRDFQRSTAEHIEAGFQSIASSMILQMGMQFSSMLICLLSIMLGAGSIAAELENGMVHAILSRPIRRSDYVLGRFCGLAIASASYALALFVGIFAIGAFFGLSTVTSLEFTQALRGAIVYLSVPLALLCLTVYGSASIKTVPNGLLMIFVYILGNIGGMVEMIGKYINDARVISWGILLSLISPFQTLFATSERILLPSTGIAGEMMRSAGGLAGSGNPPSVWMYVYIALYTVAFIALALRKFSRIDIGG